MASALRLRILAFGASLTEGYCSDGCIFHPYTIHLSHLLRSSSKMADIDNVGVSGEAILSTTMLPRLQQLLSSSTKKFDWVLILAGTNDIIRDQEKASRVFDGYKLLIDECQKHGARVLSMTLPETVYPRESPFDLQRQEFNRLIKEELISLMLIVSYHNIHFLLMNVSKYGMMKYI
jgi:lysophospholipase L1-like esterase